jgi:hypothetical protein
MELFTERGIFVKWILIKRKSLKKV